jgi:hypothetical protein
LLAGISLQTRFAFPLPVSLALHLNLTLTPRGVDSP